MHITILSMLKNFAVAVFLSYIAIENILEWNTEMDWEKIVVLSYNLYIALSHTKLIICFWSILSSEIDQATRLFSFKIELNINFFYS